MAFMEAYKRLDNLCKDLFSSDVGITEYIKSMERCSHYTLYIDNWRNDYFALKHYRYIRNKIVHENDVTEDELCTADDVIWINNFYQRILNQTDPLALYRKAAVNFSQKSNKSAGIGRSKAADIRQNSARYSSQSPKKGRKKSGYNLGALIAAAIIVVIIVAAVCLLLNFGLPL